MTGKTEEKNKERILITSALPYVNNVPHLGNIVGCVLSADVFARYLRSKKKDVIYVCGTDEHGTATETKAIEEGVSPKEICDKYFKIHSEIYKWFNCSFDCFGRTSSKIHHEMTKQIYFELKSNGFIAEEEVSQLYCEKCKKFLADRFVEGICPFCSYEDARGDQCDSCGQLINAVELKDPRCKTCGSKPTIRKTKHLFIDLPKIEPELKEWFKKRSEKWPNNARTLTENWLKEGLKKRAITRDLDWGIKIPEKGYEDKVFYVWFDAPIGYISFTKEYFKDGMNWWTDKNVKLYQFMAKDNIPFHTLIFPSVLLGTKKDYTTLHYISSTEYLNYEHTKFSKSRGIGIFGDEVMKTDIPSDVWRYYLLINRPERADSEFLWSDFQEKTNNELVANFGNLVNRTITFISKFFEGKVPDTGNIEYPEEIKNALEDVDKHLSEVKLKDALKDIMHIAKLGNQFFQEQEPWKKMKTDKDVASKSLELLANLAKDLGIIIEPYLPDTADAIFRMLDIKLKTWDAIGNMGASGNRINSPKLLFKKIENSDIDALKKRFAGKSDFDSIDLRIAKVISSEIHPDADKLLVLQLDVGDHRRQIVSGIRGNYKSGELNGKNIILVSNLKEAKLRGIKSHGMLLAASHKDKVVVLTAEGKPGERIHLKGFDTKKGNTEIKKAEIDIDTFFRVNISVGKIGILVDEDKLLVTETGNLLRCNIKPGSRVK